VITPNADRDPVEKLAEEFAERYRRGERPSLSEYTRKYPEQADEIRELFPALVLMEAFGSVSAPATGPFLPRAAASTPPAQLGEFRILREVGHGGMGVVYEAVQESLGRHVALKILPFHKLINPTHLERFRREARAAARLHHTNIVPVFGVGEHAGVHYFAMQFIQGQGLDLVLRELTHLRAGGAGAPLKGPNDPGELTASVAARGLLTGRFQAPGLAGEPPAPGAGPAPHPTEEVRAAPASVIQAGSGGTATLTVASRSELAGQTEAQYFRSVARVAVQVAEALEYAHRQGVLHRDVKPSNLLLDTEGTVWVTDFGLAKTEGEELTDPGDIVGTLRYMAPERFQGKSGPRSDVYSLGVTLYEMLALQPAFADSDRVRLIERILHEKPAPPRQRDPHVPRDLETIVLKAMAREPGDRYPSAGALADDLRRFLADRPIQARRSSVAERAWRWCRRNPVVATLAASVLVLALTLAAGSVVASMLHEERDIAVGNLQRATRAEEQTRLALKRVEQAEQDRTRQLRDSYLDQARVTRLSPRSGRRFDSLQALESAITLGRSLPPDGAYVLRLRGEVLASLALTDFRPAESWDCPAGASMLSFSTDFRHYARSDSRGELSIRAVNGDREVVHLPGPGKPAWVLQFSRDDHYLAARYENGEVRVHDWKREQVVLRIPPIGRYGLLDFSPDSTSVALGLANGDIGVFALGTGKQIRRFASGGNLHSLAFHPRGRKLAASYLNSQDAAVRVYDLDTGDFLKVPHPNSVRGLAWDPTGRLLATACADLRLRVWDMSTGKTGKLVATLEGHLATPTLVAFSHAGDLLASAGWDGMVYLWNPLTGKPLASRPGAYGVGFPRLQFSPDDRRLAFLREGPRAGLWAISRGTVCRTLRPYQGPDSEICNAVTFSPDGRLLATSGTEGLYVCDLADSRTVAFLPGKTTYKALFTGDGKGLLVGGTFGLYHWPLARAGDRGGRVITVGPPRRLAAAAEMSVKDFQWWGGENALALWDALHNQIVTLPLAGAGKKVVLGARPKGNNLAVSPDGRWVASGNWLGSEVKVWDARQARLVKELPGANAIVAFSPDGKWLVTGVGAEYRFWEVGSWQPRHRLAREGAGSLQGPMAFAPDGRVLAVLFTPNTIRLVIPETGEELVTLTAPEPRVIQALCFSPDGTRLAAACWGHVLQVWDLRLARGQLAERALDWGRPAYPPAGPQAEQETLTARVDLGELAPNEPPPAEAALTPSQRVQKYTQAIARNPEDAAAYQQRGSAYTALGLHPEAIADYTQALKRQPTNARLYEARGLNHLYARHYEEGIADLKRAVELNPERPEVLNYLARYYVTGPAHVRAPEQALPLARKALSLAPTNRAYRNTLGMVYYRLGDYPKAIAALEANVKVSKAPAAADLFVLAMSYHRQGDGVKARECYERALRWWRAQTRLTPAVLANLKACRAEADEVLAKPAPK
jgi:serine/threonine protein kinase/WD40 repeat protein/Flp pilus assembly protein TadD